MDQLASDRRPDRLGLYIHWPFCLSKCPYCDFNSHLAQDIDSDLWQRAMLDELDWMLERAEQITSKSRLVDTVFFGGGTPSLMPPSIISAILDRLARNGQLADQPEITAEANPTSAETARLAAMHTAGINRLSLGVQSLRPDGLAFLGRNHSAGEALAALQTAARLFNSVSADLIYGWPDQTLADWRADLDRITGLDIPHLSAYQLTIEPGTVFASRARRGERLAVSDDRMADFYEATRISLAGAALPAYEISNHARAGHECRHNLNYWRSGDWLGIGPGAFGRITGSTGRVETSNRRSPQGWLDAVIEKGCGLDRETSQPLAEMLEERLMMGLRLAEGVDLSADEQAGHINQDALNDFIAAGWLNLSGGRLIASPDGWLRLNYILARLLV